MKTQKVTTVGEMIKTYKAEKLFAHAPFTKGAPPAQLAAKKTMTWHTKTDAPPTVDKLLQSLGQTTKMKWLWGAGVKDGKIVPQGLVAVAMQQFTVTKQDVPVS